MGQRVASQSARQLLRYLPAVDELARDECIVEAAGGLPSPLVTDALRDVLDDVRGRLLRPADGTKQGVPAAEAEAFPQGASQQDELQQYVRRRAVDRLGSLHRSLLHRVINGTGVVLHTNLGRAPLSDGALAAVSDVASGYANLEYDVASGLRGHRDDHGEQLLTRLTGAEAALVVNNNAAAVLLVLSAIAAHTEVVLSRGEMIEIGGSFRIPEVMEQSGCTLREVGTTNRTHLHDYERALNDRTGAILKVHPSNYKVLGFTSGVTASALAPLARARQIPLIEDLGSGVLVDTNQFGLAPEPTVQQSIAAGVDLVTFSGDKLLGGPQAGIIVGRKDLVDECRRHPLTRALRVDKLTLAALQATLSDYLSGCVEHIPIYKMLSQPVSTLRQRAEAICTRFAQRSKDGAGPAADLSVRTVETNSTVGGGSLPGETLASVAVAIRSEKLGAASVAARLRTMEPPVIGRIDEEDVLLDLRTVAPADDRLIAEALRRLAGLPSSVTEAAQCTS